MDVHSSIDYIGGLSAVVLGLVAGSPAARASLLGLGLGTVATSLISDYRMSALKLIPVEVHEVLDYVVGIANIASPFSFDYLKGNPIVSTLQILGGATAILVSLFTDYRACRGRAAALFHRERVARATG